MEAGDREKGQERRVRKQGSGKKGQKRRVDRDGAHWVVLGYGLG